MKLLLRSVLIVDPQSPWNGNVVDIELSNGKVTGIAKKIALQKGFTERD
jgi:hypothetical protein